MKNKIKFVVIACRWFDKINGNTYHSANITRTSDGMTIYARFRYGYGDHYRQTAVQAMLDAKWIKNKDYERENDYPILWNVTDGLKRDCMKNGGR